MRNSGFIWIIIIIMISLDFYVFQALKLVSQGASNKVKLIIYSCYWIISILAVITLALLPMINFDNWPRSLRNLLICVLTLALTTM